ncbi:MAG: branched-chain amino acid ABC transporter permease [Clostridia bacterium]|nr:MAG: branched-chain amino acid ABC transporter permease [Clostridia bacterium]
MYELTYVTQVIFSGITSGAVYTLVALSLVLVYNVTKNLNFAQGEFSVLGILVVLSTVRAGLSLWAGVLLAVAVVAIVAFLQERLVMEPLGGAADAVKLVGTLAVVFLMQSFFMNLWGKEAYTLPHFSSRQVLELSGATLPVQSLWVMGTGVAVIILIYLFLNVTVYGKALRACSENKMASMLVGIDVEAMTRLTYALSGVMGAIGGIVFAPLVMVNFGTGLMFTLKGFMAAILGGLGDIRGAIVGGVLLGLVEAFSAGYISAHFADSISLGLLLIFLVFRPTGVLGGKISES